MLLQKCHVFWIFSTKNKKKIRAGRHGPNSKQTKSQNFALIGFKGTKVTLMFSDFTFPFCASAIRSFSESGPPVENFDTPAAE